MLSTSSDGIELIKRFEGFSAMPYRCPAGYWTIGYGHVLSQYAKMLLTQEGAEIWLRGDLVKAERAVHRLLPVLLTQHQFDALVSFTYNLGAGALQRSTLRQKILRGEHHLAAQEFKKWVYAGGRKLPGLVRRRVAKRIYMY
ncbi:MAG: lysozyme [Rickettsiales bacterium]